MPAIKNRTVLGVSKNLSGFLNLDVGLTRGPVPDNDRMLEEAHSTAADKGRQLRQTQRQLSEKRQQLTQSQGRLSEKVAQLREAQRQLSKKEEEIREVRKQLLDKDRRLAALRASADPATSQSHGEELRSDIARILDKIPIDLGGGCSLDKACLFVWLIRRYSLKQTVDIGVYRGRSLFPQALAHSQLTGGVVYGVDPYSAREAKEEDISSTQKDRETVNRFIEQTDWQAICQSVVSLRDELGYGDHCVLLRKTSADAAAFFREKDIKFDMVHVDGNHDTRKVMEDLELYVPRVKEDGFIVLDDVSFESVRPAYDELNANATLVFERTDQDGANDFAVFRVGRPSPETRYNRRVWIGGFW